MVPTQSDPYLGETRKGSSPLYLTSWARSRYYQSKKNKDKKMSYKLMHKVARIGGLEPIDKLILMLLADYANEKTYECFPSQARLAEECNRSRRVINERIAYLCSQNLIAKVGWAGQARKYKMFPLEGTNQSEKTASATSSTCNDGVTSSPSDSGIPLVTTEVTSSNPSDAAPTCNLTCNPTCNHGVTLTENIKNREESDNNSKQASILESTRESNIQTPPQPQPTMTPTPHTQPKPAPAAADDAPLTLRDVALAARAKLMADGMSREVAEGRIKLVKDAYMSAAKELRASGYVGIANPEAYLVAKLVGMAKDGPQATQEEEPQALEEIFDILKDEWKSTYPEVAEHFEFLGLADFSARTESKLRAKEEAGWATVKGSRVGFVRSFLEGAIFERVQFWRQDKIKDVADHVATLESRLARLQSMPTAYYRPPNGPTLEEHLANLEEMLAKAKEQYGTLITLTTRPSAA